MENILLVPLKLFIFLFINMLILALFLPISVAVEIVAIMNALLLLPFELFINGLILFYNLITDALDGLIEPLKDNFKRIDTVQFSQSMYWEIRNWVASNSLSGYFGAMSVAVGVLVVLLANLLLLQIEDYLF